MHTTDPLEPQLTKKTAPNGVVYWMSPDTSKPPLVLVHGFTGNHEGFQYIVPQLTQYCLIVPDLPGFGESPLTNEGWTIAGIAKQTNDFIRSLSLKQKPYLVSHSMGTLIAANMLEQNPELFHKKTIFISPVPTRVRVFDSRKVGAALGSLQYKIGAIPKIGPKFVKSHRLTKLITSFIVTTKDKAFRRTINAHHIKNLLYISDIRFYHDIHKEINKTGIDEKADALTAFDVLFIVGTKDTVTPLNKVSNASQKIKAELALISDVGHLAHYETPDRIVEAIADFLR